MPMNHSFNARAGKGRGVSPVNHWSDDDESDVEAAAEITAVLQPSRPVKTLQGHVLFTLPSTDDAAAVAEKLLALRAQVLG